MAENKYMSLISDQNLDIIVDLLPGFVQVATTATNRGTFYNSLEQIQDEVKDQHSKMYLYPIGYALCGFIPGITEFNRQLILNYHYRSSLRALRFKEKNEIIRAILPPDNRSFGARRRSESARPAV